MSLLRRIVVISKKAQLHDVVRKIAHEVFVADDPAEGRQIVNTVTPEMILFDATLSPDQVRDFLHETDNDSIRPVIRVVVVSADTPHRDEEYQNAGVSFCVRGCGLHESLAG